MSKTNRDSAQVHIFRDEKRILVTAFFEVDSNEVLLEGAEDIDGNDIPLTREDEEIIVEQIYQSLKEERYDRAEQNAMDAYYRELDMAEGR